MDHATGPNGVERFSWGPYWVEMEWGEVSGRLELVGLSIRSLGDEAVTPITTTTLRRIPLTERRLKLTARWEERARADRAIREASPEQGALPEGFETKLQSLGLSGLTPTELAARMTGWPEGHPRAGRPALWTDERLKEAARVYGAAYEARQSPTAAVAAHFNLSAKGAAKVVGMARKANYLPPARQGRPDWWGTKRESK